jgi:hypothetical protein
VLFTSPRGAIFSDTAAIIDYIFHGISNVPPEPEEEYEEENPGEETEPGGEIEEPEVEPEEEPEAIEEVSAPIKEDEPPYEPAAAVSETVPAFVYAAKTPSPDEYAPPAAILPQELSNTQAAAVASMSVAMTAAALLIVWLMYKKLS